ncbi:EAL and HDOD domain-containing protein [Pontibacillus litoralis]|uniref:HDOD domain-containing protein n=1 Tax=Pontibacillus litoralis JSM 072002 TaxID=1385512 RepID=A0A0A5G7N5_9BACI|nr:EAL domain-containing protein [Pontibacillus litoralis]KGX87193.1 hypothetical protein N784_16240 [Pontibacillus litoralis JSM 072002]
MEVCVARQPILNEKQEVIAYELLYRGNQEQNYYSLIDGDEATANVVMNSFFNIGLQQISDGKRCFVNFTENLLRSNLPYCFPPRTLVIEILENIQPSKEVVYACRNLKREGYRIALDDYILDESNPYSFQLLKYADIIKIDIQQTPLEEQRYIFHRLQAYDLIWLAEKVETREEYQVCKELGYHYFQGYFFSKPAIMKSHDVELPPFYHMDLMKELFKEEPNVKKVVEKIELDVSLSYKLLRLTNTIGNRRLERVKSIEQAVMLVGLNEVKKWAYVLVMRNLKNQQGNVAEEALKISFLRARMCENVAEIIGQRDESASYFLTGMLSLIELFMQQSMQDSLEGLALDEQIKDALLGEPNKYRDVLDLCQLIERGEWDLLEQRAANLSLSIDNLFQQYKESLIWTQALMKRLQELGGA